MAPKITLHWLDDSRAQRILWLLEELALEYEIKVYKRNEKNLAPKELYDVHPLGKSPVIEVDGTILAESGAITEFLIERFGQGKLSIPADSSDLSARASYLYWLHYAEGSAMFPVMLTMIFTQIPKSAPWFLRPVVNTISSGALTNFVIPRCKQHFAFFDKSLEGKDFLVGGKLTGADVMMVFLAEALQLLPLEKAEYPNIQRWYEALQQRPAYKTAEEKGAKPDLGRFLN
ncbi:hypothetical protein JCM8547_001688 [Rhodosporidiobolus lusitaniae]